MLQTVFKDLYDKGVLLFIDTDTYVTNNAEVDVMYFADRNKFKEIYTEKVEFGWVFSYTNNLHDILTTLKDDACCLVEFGFNSDTEEKTLETGRSLVKSLLKFNFMANWDERALKEHKITTIIKHDDLPQHIQDLIEDES
jgi:hypothetical protein